MLTISNGLSFARIPLAFLFLVENAYLRCVAVVLAMITDSIDGYLARRNNSVSLFGAILDPIADKFFVYFALTVLFCEGRLFAWQAVMMLSRDIAVCFYSALMIVFGGWRRIVIQSFRTGKVFTTLQFFVLMGLIFHLSFSWSSYTLFVLIGGIAFIELLRRGSPVVAKRWNVLGQS